MADELDEAELDRIENRAAAALPIPWESSVEGRDHDSGDSFILTGARGGDGPDMYVSLSYWQGPGNVPASAADLDFIACARQDVPRLVAEVRRLRRGHLG